MPTVNGVPSVARMRRVLVPTFVMVAGLLAAATPWPSDPARAEASSFVSLVPGRVMETRDGLNTVDGQFNAMGIRQAQSETPLKVTGRAGVADDAKAVVLNLAVTGSSAGGFVTIWPCGLPRPTASSLNYDAGQTISNAVTAQIGSGGQICIYTLTATHVIIDVTGAYPSTAGFQGLVPGRVLETRPGENTTDGQFAGVGIRNAGSITELVVRNRAGAGNAEAVVLNVAVTGSTAAGFVTLYPCGSDRPNAASLNYNAGQTISNAVTAKVGPNGAVCIYVFSSTHVIVDLTGAFPAGAGYNALVPGRLLETRAGLNTVDGQANGYGIRPAGSETELLVGGRAGVGAVDAVVLNVAVTGSSAAGFVTIFPCGSQRPNASSLNFSAGQTISNAVTAKVGSGGRICIYVLAATHVIIDVTGYFPGSIVGDPSSTSTTTSTRPSTLPGEKPKLQAVYAYPSSGRPLSGLGIEVLLAQELKTVTDWYAGETGGRRPDFVTGLLGVEVMAIQLSMTAGQANASGGWIAAGGQIKNQLPANRYPVIFYDGTSADGFCGIAHSQGFVWIPIHNCGGNGVPKGQPWPYGPTYLFAHEIGHALGAVPACAPHHIAGGHVGDNRTDLMYEGPGKDILNTRLDPGHDDYYNPVPGAICGNGNIINSPLMTP